MLSHFAAANRRERRFSDVSNTVGDGPYRGTEPKASHCLIMLDRGNRIYWSGDTLSGKIVVALKSEKIIRGIQLHIFGKSSCQFSMEEKKDAKYSNKEVVLSEHIQLVDQVSTHLAGRYAYQFRFDLPFTLPTSVSDQHGCIQYNVKAVVKVSMRRDIKAREEFQVIKPNDLNQFPELQTPLELLAKHTIRPLCCMMVDKIFMIGRVATRGYAVGDAIPLELRVINESRYRIHRVKVKLCRVISHQPYEKKANIVAHSISDVREETCDGCPAFASEQHTVELIVPPLTLPTDLTNRLCRIEYAVLAIAYAGRGRRHQLELRIPIVIGTETYMAKNQSIDTDIYSLMGTNMAVADMNRVAIQSTPRDNFQHLAIEYPSGSSGKEMYVSRNAGMEMSYL